MTTKKKVRKVPQDTKQKDETNEAKLTLSIVSTEDNGEPREKFWNYEIKNIFKKQDTN